jgi:coiled-coil domain-containing protein 77
VTYFIKEPPGKLIINQKHENNNKSSNKKSDVNHHSEEAYSSNTAPTATGKYPRDYESLLLQINSLETQIAEQTKQSREQIDALLEDRKTRGEEFEAQRLKDACMIKELREKLLQTQQLLHESTKDFLELKYSCRQNERHWMHEKDRLLKDLDKSNKHENIKDDEVFRIDLF